MINETKETSNIRYDRDDNKINIEIKNWDNFSNKPFSYRNIFQNKLESFLHNISYCVFILMLVEIALFSTINTGDMSFDIIKISLIMLISGGFMFFWSVFYLPKKLYITVRPLEIILSSGHRNRETINIEKSNIKDITIHKVSAKGCTFIYIFLNCIKPVKFPTFSKKTILLYQDLGEEFHQTLAKEEDAKFIVAEMQNMLSINEDVTPKLEDSSNLLKKFKE